MGNVKQSIEKRYRDLHQRLVDLIIDNLEETDIQYEDVKGRPEDSEIVLVLAVSPEELAQTILEKFGHLTVIPGNYSLVTKKGVHLSTEDPLVYFFPPVK